MGVNRVKAVILCGGKGTRLQEETEFRPKPLVKIGVMPILWHIMKHYSFYGVKDFILPIGYKGEMIKEYFLNFEVLSNNFTLNLRSKGEYIVHENDATLEDWRITFVDTGQETQTGGRVARIRKYLGDESEFFLTYGDAVSNVDINTLLDFHRQQGRVLTLTGVKQTSPFGVLEVETGLAKSFKEKPRLDGLVSGGFFVCDNSIFDYLNESESCVFEEGPMKTMARDGQVAVYEHNGYWQCMDTYKQVMELNKVWESGSVPWKVW